MQIHTSTHIHIHIHTYTHIHTHTYIHIHTFNLFAWLSFSSSSNQLLTSYMAALMATNTFALYIEVYICMYLYISIYMYVDVYKYEQLVCFSL